VGDTITFASNDTQDGIAITWNGASTIFGGATITTGIGINDVINTGNHTAGTLTISLTGDVTGALSSGSFGLTTLNNVTFTNQSFIKLGLGNATNEALLGAGAASQVNVATATTLAQALDIAAATAAAGDVSGKSTIAANTGIVDWFQFGGNTYIVEANNNTALSATHSALAANDVVVKLTGLIDLSGSIALASNVLTV
jgi:hypothetical protein